MLRNVFACVVALGACFTINGNPVLMNRVVAEEAAASFEQKSLETLGATLVAYCINAHVTVSLVSEAYENEQMEEERANSLIDTNVGLLDTVGPSVIAMTKYEECSEDDKKVLVGLAKCFKAIKAESVALKAYVESSDEETLKAFQEKSAAAQTEIDTLLK